MATSSRNFRVHYPVIAFITLSVNYRPLGKKNPRLWHSNCTILGATDKVKPRLKDFLSCVRVRHVTSERAA